MRYCWPAIYKCGTPLQRQEKKKGPARASPMAAPMPKSIPGLMREKIDFLESECVCARFRTFHRWGGLVYIVYIIPY